MRWFVKGDLNTNFFNLYINRRRTRLRLDEITSMDGDVINTVENIRVEAVRYFEK